MTDCPLCSSLAKTVSDLRDDLDRSNADRDRWAKRLKVLEDRIDRVRALFR